MRLRSIDFRQILRPNAFFNRKSALRSRIPSASPEVGRRPRSDFPLHFNSQNIYQIRMETSNASARRLPPAALLERWPQVCRVTITFTLLPANRFVSTTTNSMKCVAKWTPLRLRVRLRNTQPHLKGLFYSRLQKGWQNILRLFLKLFLRTRILPMGFTISSR